MNALLLVGGLCVAKHLSKPKAVVTTGAPGNQGDTDVYVDPYANDPLLQRNPSHNEKFLRNQRYVKHVQNGEAHFYTLETGQTILSYADYTDMQDDVYERV